MNFEMNRAFGFVFFVTLVLCANAFPRFTKNSHELEDGELLEIKSADTKNVVGSPVNCPAGQRPDSNGRCRPTFRDEPETFEIRNIVDSPIVCPPGQRPDHRGKCRDEFALRSISGNAENTNVVGSPVVCPPGQKPDSNNKCRPVAKSNNDYFENAFEVEASEEEASFEAFQNFEETY